MSDDGPILAFAAVTGTAPVGVIGYLLAGPVAAYGAGIALVLLLAVAAFMWVMDWLSDRRLEATRRPTQLDSRP